MKKSNKIFTVAECMVPAGLAYIIEEGVKRVSNGKEWTKEWTADHEGLSLRDKDYLRDMRYYLTDGVVNPILTFGTSVYAAPTNMLGSHCPYVLERDKNKLCVPMTVQTMVPARCGARTQRMEEIVNETMNCYQSDFRIWDMHTLCRLQREDAFLWAVSSSDTYIEAYDATTKACVAVEALRDKKDARTVQMYLEQNDGTWMGSALRVAISDRHRLFYWNGNQLLEVPRDCFERLHKQFREGVANVIRHMMEAQGLNEK